MNYSKINAFSVIVGISLLQSVAAQEGFDAEPSLVNITDNVFRTVHRPGAANSVVIATDEGLVVVDGTCRGKGDPA